MAPCIHITSILGSVNEALTGKQTAKVSRYNSSSKTLSTLFERNITDAYGNPGTPLMAKNSFGKQVILVEGNKIFLNNTVGSSPKGDLPFLSLFECALPFAKAYYIRTKLFHFWLAGRLLHSHRLVRGAQRGSLQWFCAAIRGVASG